MNKFVRSIFDLGEMEQLSRRKQWPNELHPSVKILITIIYIIMVTAIDRYELGRALMLGIYPILMISISDIPVKAFISKLIIPAFFAISLGIVNPMIDRDILLVIGGIGVSGGFISLLTLMTKALLTISATLILVSTTSVEALGTGMKTMKIPSRLVILFLLMYRYIGILLSEVNRTMEAYQLRSSGSKGIHFRSWGSLVGQIVIRSYKRSEEIYNAMQLRGYSADER